MASPRFLSCILGFLLPALLVAWPARDWSEEETAGFYGRPVAIRSDDGSDNIYSRHVVCYVYDRPLWSAYIIEAGSYRKEQQTPARPRASSNYFRKVGRFTHESFGGSFHPHYPDEQMARGHLTPDAAVKWFGSVSQGDQAQKETYRTDNIVPQIGSHNGGVWGRLESDLRAASAEQPVWVVVGGIYEENIYLGNDAQQRPPIPTHMFCAVLAVSDDGELGAVGIVVEHKPGAVRRIVSIDELERITGIDFFPSLGPLAEISFELPKYVTPRRTRTWHLK